MGLKLLIMFSFFYFVNNEEVRVTVYHIKGKTSTGEITTAIKEPFVAVSRDLLLKYPMNSIMIVDDCPFAGKYIVKDKMNKRLFKTIDVFIKSKKKKYNPCKCKIYTPEEFELFKAEELIPKIDSIKVDSLMLIDTLKQ